MDEFKKNQTKGIVALIAIVVLIIVISIVTPLVSSAIQGYIFMWCNNNGLVKILSDYINPITFLQAFCIVFSVGSIRSSYAGLVKYGYSYLEDDFEKGKKWIAWLISFVMFLVIFIIDIVVFQYTYDTILPQVLKFKLPELDDVQLLAVFYGLNIIFRHPAPNHDKKEKE